MIKGYSAAFFATDCTDFHRSMLELLLTEENNFTDAAKLQSVDLLFIHLIFGLSVKIRAIRGKECLLKMTKSSLKRI
jgi:hypothetical protein